MHGAFLNILHTHYFLLMQVYTLGLVLELATSDSCVSHSSFALFYFIFRESVHTSNTPQILFWELANSLVRYLVAMDTIHHRFSAKMIQCMRVNL